MLQADEARLALKDLPVRANRRLGTYRMLISVGDRKRARETTIWLHKINGDEAKGKEKREYRKEFGYAQEAGEKGEFGDAQDPTEIATGEQGEDAKESAEKLEVKVSFDDVVHRGMPLAYLDGLSDVAISARGQTTKDRTVVTRWEVHGRHTGELLGVPPTGRDVTTSGMTVVKFDEVADEDGQRVSRALEAWTYWDVPTVAEQIGARL